MTVMIKPTNNITTATGIVKNINQGSAAQLQFASLASGPQNKLARGYAIKNGETAKIGDSPVITKPVMTNFRELFDVVASSVIYIVYFISRRARRDSST